MAIQRGVTYGRQYSPGILGRVAGAGAHMERMPASFGGLASF